jgi:UDP-N-acetylmuramoyl-L-alanyl-D-glutamate--2,6-diaminopimelate ligase
VVVPDTRRALADLAAEYFGHPSGQLQLYAVTGTDGKTTTVYLLEQVLARAGLCTGVIGTVELKVGALRTPNVERMTTPESLDLQRLLHQMVDAGVTHVAMEASSHALSLHRLRGCRFAACALTNITGDHLEFHGSWDAYVEAKSRLFTELAADRPAILNRDDESYGHLAARVGSRVLSYGVHSAAHIRAVDLETGARSTSFSIEMNGRRAHVTLGFPGVFNVSNALAAAGLAVSAGLPLEAIADALSRAAPPPGRMQAIASGQPFEVLVDYAHTPHAFRSALAGVRRTLPPEARLIAVFGAAGGRDHAKRPLLAQIAREHADFFFITNEDPCDEDPLEIIAEVAAGVAAGEEGRRFEREPDRGCAIARAVGMAKPGDAVIILGKGHEQSIVVGNHKDPWSDVLVAREAIEAMG